MSPVHSQSSRLALRRKRLMLSCASAAMAAAILLPQRGLAQAVPGAFQGSIGSYTGSVGRATSGTTETITIGTPTATINWSPFDSAVGGGPVDFLPTGNAATFTSSPGLTDYTVLNRIVPNDPSRSILLDGSVASTLEGTSSAGGNIWFYSPGGIVIGPNSTFDVGGLLLTTADLPNGFAADASGFSGFFSAPNSASSIQIQDGAQITAANSYVALVAPRIEQGGAVTVNGSAAYVAAEQLSMSFSQGLFDVSVDVGTDDMNGIVHTGSTTGAGNASAADHHSIYMVAVPKNYAITMLLDGGSAGFSDVQNATVENGQIILSAGYSVSHDDSNAVVINDLNRGGAIAGPDANLEIVGGDFSSDVSGYATGTAYASGGGGVLNFARDLTLQGLLSSDLVSTEGDTVTVGGNAGVHADDLRYFLAGNEGDSVDASAGGATIAALGGSLTIAGNATVSANASPTVNTVTGYGGTSNGGSAAIEADGGNLTIGGDASVEAYGFGDTLDNGADGRASYGGYGQVVASNGGSLDICGGLSVVAEGHGSYSALASGGVGGTGYGGIANIWADGGGSIVVGGTSFVSASGIGGQLISSTDGTGGEGRGGNTQLGATAGGSIDFGSDADFTAAGIGGSSPATAGEGDGGDATLFIDGGSIKASATLRLFANGVGGAGLSGGAGYGGYASAAMGGSEGASAGGTLDVIGEFRVQGAGTGGNGLDSATGAGGNAGDAYGGSADFYTTNFLQPDAIVDVHLGTVAIAANGEGGFGGAGTTGGNGGSGFAGDATTELYGGTIHAGEFQTFATARGGSGGAGSSGAGGKGGSASGGWSDVVIATDVTATTTFSYDRALAGFGGAGTSVGAGGAASGGNATMEVLAGGHLTGNADLSTAAFAGNGGTGGDAAGGWSSLTIEGAQTGGLAQADSSATGGNGSSGNAGSASGGESEIDARNGGSITVATLNVLANGNGGAGLNGGDAFGGSAQAGANDGATSALRVSGTATATANATGGNGLASGSGGDGFGGDAGIHAGVDQTNIAGTATFNNAVVQANGFGGAGGIAGDGTGGSGHAGTREGTFVLTGNLSGQAQGNGGQGIGGPGATGTGGYFLIAANFEGDANPASTTIANATVSTIGFGGNGGAGAAGGDGYGGQIDIEAATANSTLGLGTVSGNAKGQGGDGGDGNTGGAGGSGYGGSISTSILGKLTGGDLAVSVRGVGGQGGTGSAGLGGDGGYGEGGSASFYSGADSLIDAGTYVANVNGIGGDGGAGSGGQGNGGSGQSGWDEAVIDGSASFGGSLTGTVTTGFVITAFAQGGSGANGGSATAGASSIAVNGDLHSTGIVQAAAQAIGGSGTAAGGVADAGSASIAVNGDLSSAALFIGTNATGGNGATSAAVGTGGASALTVNSGSADIGQWALLQARGFGAADGVGGDVALQLNPAADVQFADLTASADGIGGTIEITGALTSTGLVELNAGGDIGFANLTADRLDAESDDGAINGGNVVAATRVSADADGAVTLGDITTGPAVPADDFSVGIASATSIDVGNVIAPGRVGFATFGNLTTGNIAAGDLAMMLVGGDISVGSLTTGPGGQVYLANASMFEAAGGGENFDPALVLAANPVATGGSITLGGPVSTGTFRAASGANFTAAPIAAATSLSAASGGNLSVDALTSGGSVSLTAGGLASFTGTVSAPTIAVTSRDIDLAAGASLGVAGITGAVTLHAVGDQPVLIGDSIAAAQAPQTTSQYWLSQSEADRIHSNSLKLNATSTGSSPAQVVIRDLTLKGSTAGGFSSVDIGTAGSVRVLGDLAYINAAASDALTIAGGERLEVITPDGSIRMVGANDMLAGLLTLKSANIVVTNSTLSQQLAADPNFAGRDTALATNTGAVTPAGFVQAGGISLLTSGNIFIQNTGTATEFAGLTVGGQGLLVGRYSAVTNSDGTQTFSFTGTLTTANDVLYFDFTVSSESQITLRTYSYAGGTNGAGQDIPSGGFDPILSLFDAAGHLINSNDDGGSDVPADPTTGAHYDTFLQSLLPSGTYTVAVTAFSNFPVSDRLSDGFQGTGSLNGRNPNFAFDVSGANNVTGPSDQPITVIAFGRRQNQDGSFTTGNAFFNTVAFGKANGVEYTDASTVNGCSVNAGCPVPPPDPQPEPQAPPAVLASQSILGPVGMTETAAQTDTVSPDDSQDSEADDDSGGSQAGSDASLHLINTAPLKIDSIIDEPVTSGNDGPGGPL